MKSRTKLELDTKTIIRLFGNADIEDAENISPLGAGEYNSVYSVDEKKGGLHRIDNCHFWCHARERALEEIRDRSNL
jgi:hypothetical protein